MEVKDEDCVRRLAFKPMQSLQPDDLILPCTPEMVDSDKQTDRRIDGQTDEQIMLAARTLRREDGSEEEEEEEREEREKFRRSTA